MEMFNLNQNEYATIHISLLSDFIVSCWATSGLFLTLCLGITSGELRGSRNFNPGFYTKKTLYSLYYLVLEVAAQETTGYWASNQCWPHARQIPYSLCYLFFLYDSSFPNKTLLRN